MNEKIDEPGAKSLGKKLLPFLTIFLPSEAPFKPVSEIEIKNLSVKNWGKCHKNIG